jgi:pimeloyl-ACP methyl ester carboxylesterase
MQGARKIEVTANGIRFVAFERGKGPLVLCLHGFPDLPTSFRHQVPALVEAGFRVVAPYMRGYAPTSPAADGCYQVAALGRDVLALIEALGETRASIVSHDWGSLAAYAAAIKDPARIERMVTVAVPYGLAFAQAFLANYDQLKRSWYVHFFQHPMAEGAVAADGCAFIRRLWRDWSPGWEPPAGILDEVCGTLGRPEVLGAALGYYRALLDPAHQRADLAAEQNLFQLASIQVPTLYIHGARDGCMGVETSDGMEASFPAGLRKLVVEGAGHFVLLEKPDVVNPAILEWLKASRA